ncbi:H/ACA ribonucleoprotein complex subunit 2-like protein [Culicoides brevitarsis]|uniref:H/ACA ribonucleoprotein complex subunit 2-like protein n=1 Tax=Culicoides brevitarsis TaxID=469753 RepID=UPI00307B713A
MGKVKKEKLDESVVSVKEEPEIKEEDTYEEKVKNVCKIAAPLASKKLTKRIYKLIKKAAKQKSYLRNGLKDVQTRLRKGETGLVIFAGDVTPIDIMCHLPAVCEEKAIPYCFTPSRKDLGVAMGVKRGSVAMLIREHGEYKDLYDELRAEIQTLPTPL